MDNRNFQSAASTTAPTSPASPSNGYPTNGNPATGTVATQPGAFWFHKIGEELRAVITGAGLTPSDSDLTQVFKAIQADLGNCRNVAKSITVNTTLLNSEGGEVINVNGGSSIITITLPTPSSANIGVAYYFNNKGSKLVNVTTPSGNFNPDPLITGTYPLYPYASAIIVSDGTDWAVFGGLPPSLLAANGYQKLPSGMIIQWGKTYIGDPGTNGASFNTVFPIAFPNTVFSLVVSVNHTGGGSNYGGVAIESTDISNTSFNSYVSEWQHVAQDITINYIAIGN